MGGIMPNGFYRTFSCEIDQVVDAGFLLTDLIDPVAAMACYGTTFPAHEEAPLLRKDDGGKWPLVVFR
jgi:hypothetical protein